MESARGEINALVNRAGLLAGRLAKAGWRATGRLPGGDTVQQQVQRFEQALRTGVGTRHVVSNLPTRASDDVQPTLVGPAAEQATALRAAMAELLNRSIEHNRESSRQYLFSSILSQLVPDEARILAALSDGSRYPVVHVVARGADEAVLRNASTVGKAAGVAAFQYVPHYLSRLDYFGLLRFEGEAEDLGVQYDILLTEDLVQQAVEQARGGRRLAPHLQRRTVLLSDLGEQFWRACDPTEHDSRVPDSGVPDPGMRVTEPKAGYKPGA